MFYGILMEERILVVTDEIDRFTIVIEAIFELLFPFSPINYRTISYLTEDMTVFLGLPCPFVIACLPRIYDKINKYDLKEYKAELMILNLDTDTIEWEREVKYPQPHTQYFTNTLTMLKQIIPNSKIKISRSLSVSGSEEEQLKSLKKYMKDNLQIKQTFVNCILMLLNNFLGYENFKFVDSDKKIKELVFDSAAYIRSINKEFHPFYRRVLESQMFNSFLKEKNETHCVRAKEFLKYYNI